MIFKFLIKTVLYLIILALTFTIGFFAGEINSQNNIITLNDLKTSLSRDHKTIFWIDNLRFIPLKSDDGIKRYRVEIHTTQPLTVKK